MADRSSAGQLSAVALAAIAACTVITRPFEGRVLHTYPDVVLGWAKTTACDGHTGPELRPGQTFTPAECDAMQAADLRVVYDREAKCLDISKLNANQLGAFLDLGYNLGAGAVCGSSIPGKVRSGQLGAACATIEEFDKAGGKDCHLKSSNCPGIIRRRAAERALCERPTT